MSILSANLTTLKNEVFYTDSSPVQTLVTSTKIEVLYLNSNTAPENFPHNALVTSSRLEVQYGGIAHTNITVTKKEVLRTVTQLYQTALLTTVKKEALYTTHPNTKITSVKNEVLLQSRLGEAHGNITTVKNEVLYAGPNAVELTATKLEVLRSLATGPFGTIRRLLVLWNPEGYG